MVVSVGWHVTHGPAFQPYKTLQPAGLPAAHPGLGRGRAAALPGHAARPGRPVPRAPLRLPVEPGRRAARARGQPGGRRVRGAAPA